MGGVVKVASLVRVALMVSALAVAAVNAPSIAQNAQTTRIEPKPVYGATVTIEEGVRVFRPLPSEQRVIVNPGGMTPLSINTFDYSRSPPASQGSGR